MTRESTAILNKWSIKHPQIEIPIKTIEYLITLGFLEFDSGNMENGERHYTYNKYAQDKFHWDERSEYFIIKDLLPILRKIQLEKILND